MAPMEWDFEDPADRWGLSLESNGVSSRLTQYVTDNFNFDKEVDFLSRRPQEEHVYGARCFEKRGIIPSIGGYSHGNSKPTLPYPASRTFLTLAPHIEQNMDQFSCKGQTAVITGACQGMGLCYAQALASAGANIAALDSNPPDESLDQLAVKYGVEVVFYRTDVTNAEDIDTVISKVEKALGPVNICITAHVVATGLSFLTQRAENVNQEAVTNYIGAFLIAQACAKSMIRRVQAESQPAPSGQSRSTEGGSIVFTASVWTHFISAGQTLSTYAASKAAVRGLVKPLAMELAQYGIRVNSLSPGPIETGVILEWKKTKPDAIRQFKSETLFGRLGSEEELKGVILFLSSRASSWVTGTDICVDGGSTAWKHPGSSN